MRELPRQAARGIAGPASSRLRRRRNVAALALLLLACGGEVSSPGDAGAPAEPAARARALDAAPRESRLPTPLPRGTARAFFALETGGDQMAGAPREAGLALVVRTGDRELRQTFASCSDPSLGSALGGGTQGILEVAFCDGEYRLLAEPGAVVVRRMRDDAAGDVAARIPLPSGTQVSGRSSDDE